jgi:hypothetical protein
MYTIIASFKRPIILCTHITVAYIYMAHFPLLPLLMPLAPFADSPCTPFSTYLAPSSCDRNRPPSSQVACKLTLFAPPFTQLSHPFQLPRTPTVQRLVTTTLGLLRSCYAEQLWNKLYRLRVDFIYIFKYRN